MQNSCMNYERREGRFVVYKRTGKRDEGKMMTWRLLVGFLIPIITPTSSVNYSGSSINREIKYGNINNKYYIAFSGTHILHFLLLVK